MAKQEQIIQERLQRLTERMKQLGYNDYMVERVKERVGELQKRGVNCVDRFVQKLLDRIGDKEAYLDILMEGRFAIILARNNFSDIEIEYAEKGPDLKARYNRKTVYFEVTRKRPSEDNELFSQPGGHFTKHARIENIISKIQEKMGQLQCGEVNIVVIWSDAIAWHQPALGKAFGYIKQEIYDDPTRYKDLSAILFTEGGGVSPERLTPFQLFKNDKASNPLGTRLARKLESLYERNPKQLQREFEELAAALKRLVDKRNG